VLFRGQNSPRALAWATYYLEIIRSSLSTRRGLTSAIFITDGKCPHSDSQFEPFYRFRRELREQLGFVFITFVIAPEQTLSPYLLRFFDVVSLNVTTKHQKTTF